jgi:hypothetical protein
MGMFQMLFCANGHWKALRDAGNGSWVSGSAGGETCPDARAMAPVSVAPAATATVVRIVRRECMPMMVVGGARWVTAAVLRP